MLPTLNNGSTTINEDTHPNGLRTCGVAHGRLLNTIWTKSTDGRKTILSATPCRECMDCRPIITTYAKMQGMNC